MRIYIFSNFNFQQVPMSVELHPLIYVLNLTVQKLFTWAIILGTKETIFSQLREGFTLSIKYVIKLISKKKNDIAQTKVLPYFNRVN